MHRLTRCTHSLYSKEHALENILEMEKQSMHRLLPYHEPQVAATCTLAQHTDTVLM